MNCIDFCNIFKYCVKQLMIFGRTVVAASDLKNCTMVNCDGYCKGIFLHKLWLGLTSLMESTTSKVRTDL